MVLSLISFFLYQDTLETQPWVTVTKPKVEHSDMKPLTVYVEGINCSRWRLVVVEESLITGIRILETWRTPILSSFPSVNAKYFCGFLVFLAFPH